MEKQETKSWVLTPNINLVTMGLECKDILTYITIRSFINGKTKECYPSIRSIAAKGELDAVFISKSLIRLVKAGLITIAKGDYNKSNRYYFEDVKLFKSIPTDILEVKGLSPSEKALMICIRQFFKDERLTSIYLQPEMAERLGMNFHTFLNKYTVIKKKGFFTHKLVTLNLNGGPETKQEITLNCEMFDWQIKIEKRLTESEDKIESLEKQVAAQQQEMEAQQNEMAELRQMILKVI